MLLRKLGLQMRSRLLQLTRFEYSVATLAAFLKQLVDFLHSLLIEHQILALVILSVYSQRRCIIGILVQDVQS